MSAPQIIVALLTPFGEDGALELAALGSHVDFLVGEGVDGLLVAGTTGEGPLLEEDELVELVSRVVEVTAGRVPVVANVGRPSTSATIRLIRRVCDAGVERLAAVTPYYYTLAERELLAHYRAILDAAGDVHVLAYAIPSRTNNDISPAAVRTLAREGLAGIKDSTKSLERHVEYLQVAEGPDDCFAVYMGSDGMAYESMARGSAGCMSAIANVRPDLLLALRQASFSRSDSDVDPLRAELSGLRDELARHGSVVGLKHALAKACSERGERYPRYARPPLQPAQSPAQAILAPVTAATLRSESGHG